MEDQNSIKKGPFITPGDRIYLSTNKETPRKVTIWIGVLISCLFIGSFIGVYTWQKQWGPFSGEAASLLFKKNLGTLSTKELYTLVNLYETQNDFHSAEEIYTILDKREPNNPDVMFNLGILLWHNQQYQKASSCFKQILDRDHLSSNLCYWYGKSLAALARDKEALEWHYQAMELDDNNLSNVIDILTLLKKLKRPSEGLSLIAGYAALYPYPNVEHQLKPFKVIFRELDSVGENSSFSIPEINNQYLVPIIFPLLKEHTPFIIDTGAQYMLIPRSLYSKGIAINKPTGRKIQIIGVGGAAGIGEEVLLEQIEIGGIKLKNVEAVIADNCPALLGQNVLKRLHLKTETKSGKNFLTISY
ncbi:MAG: retroviral-like aspartic protease family protein [Alphaproteobacteria bacterium]|nr:retroviral-like aspartic protease family protein [Alphaproteobacteria bacterium]